MTSVPRHTKKRNPDIEWGFHAVIPRIVRTQYKDLNIHQKWLYVCLKDLCGETGTCYRTLDVLAEETGISKQMLSVSIPLLHKYGLIHAEKKKRAASSTKGVWHITIVDIWQANGKAHPTKKTQGEYPYHGYSIQEHPQNEGEYPYHGQEYPYHGSSQSCEAASSVPADAQNEVVSSINRSSIKKEEGPPPPLTFPSEKTLPGETLFPSKQIPPPALSNVPPDVQQVINNWASALGLPAIHADKKILDAAEKLAPYNLSVADLKSIKQFCLDDNPGWFRDKLKGKVTLDAILKNVAGWKSAQQTRQAQQPANTNVGVSGKPKIDTTSDDYRAFAQAMGGN